jgi:hypothetical protein
MTFNYDAAAALLLARLPEVPVIKGWNRLEGRPRAVNFERALRAEVRDALWFLSRQWQFGEFAGEDAASPVQARTIVKSKAFETYSAAGGSTRPYARDIPLEGRVEAETVPVDLRRHVQVARYFFALIARQAKFTSIRELYLAAGAYGLPAAAIVGELDDDADFLLLLASNKLMDSMLLLGEIASGAHDTRVDGFPGLSAVERDDLKRAGTQLLAWSQRFTLTPADAADDAWVPRFLEYQFGCTAVGSDLTTTSLVAKEYEGGHLDWYSFDIGAGATAGNDIVAPAAVTPDTALTFIPAPVSFSGMPSPRYWELESRRTEFAQLDVNTTDIAKLLLTEFTLVYSNDWCVIPYEVDVGTLCEIPALLVTDDFGETTLVRAAGAGANNNWQGWSMFALNVDGSKSGIQTQLVITPAVTKIMEGPPIERVFWLRDEMSNMAWAVEKIVPGALGNGLNGYDVARNHTAVVPAPPRHPTRAKARYVLGTDVPHNWHPFIPVHNPGSDRSVSLQRARMPGPGRDIFGRVLSVPAPYFVNEEEVTRAGKQVERNWQRARWAGGSTALWLGRKVGTGRGEGSSGLAFDQVIELKSGD